jgi:hypothetical protein
MKSLELGPDVVLYVDSLPGQYVNNMEVKSPEAKALEGKSFRLGGASPETLGPVAESASNGWMASLIGPDVDQGKVRVIAIGSGNFYSKGSGAPQAPPRWPGRPATPASAAASEPPPATAR